MIPPRILLSLLLLLPWLTGCIEHDMTDLKRDLNRIRARPPTPIEPLPPLVPSQPFVFVPGDRRDPFVMDRRAEVAGPGQELAPDPNRHKEVPGEFLDLDATRMVGYLKWQKDDRIAALVSFGNVNQKPRIVRTDTDIGSPDRQIDLLTAGRFLGTNTGMIRKIDERQIEVNEIMRNERGYFEQQQQIPLQSVADDIRYEPDIYRDDQGIYRQRPISRPSTPPAGETGQPAAAPQSAPPSNGDFIESNQP